MTWRPVIFDECGLEWDHNLDVSARMLPKRGNNFFDACDFKGLGAVKCGQRMTFSNLRAMNLLIVVRHIMGRIFLRTSTNSTVFNRTRLELLVKIITASCDWCGSSYKSKAMQT